MRDTAYVELGELFCHLVTAPSLRTLRWMTLSGIKGSLEMSAGWSGALAKTKTKASACFGLLGRPRGTTFDGPTKFYWSGMVAFLSMWGVLGLKWESQIS
jgi:hypothetical protein